MTTMKDNKYLHDFINKVFPPKTVNAVYSTADFLVVLSEAAQKNGFLEGTCKRVDGACDAETIFGKLTDLKPRDIHITFVSLITPGVKRAKTLSRNRKLVLAGDITYEAYYGDDNSEWIHGYRPEKGSTGSYAFLAISIVFNGQRLILGYLPLRVSDKPETVLEDLLAIAMNMAPIDAILLDRGFNSAKVIKTLQRKGIKYVILWKKYGWHRETFKSMGREKFYRMKHELYIKDEEITVKTDMVFINGIKAREGERTYRWVFATNVHRERPIHYIYLYKHRWAIETKFRVTDELWIKTKTADIGKRFFLALFTVLLYNLWKVFRHITELDVAFSEFADHFIKVQLEFTPARKLKEKQQVIRECVRRVCFGAPVARTLLFGNIRIAWHRWHYIALSNTRPANNHIFMGILPINYIEHSEILIVIIIEFIQPDHSEKIKP